MRTLVVTNAADTTADYLCHLLSVSGHPFLRINTEDLHLLTDFRWNTGSDIQVVIQGKAIRSCDVGTVWYRRPLPVRITSPEIRDDGDRIILQGEWTAAFEGFLWRIPKVRWINHPADIMGASSKLEQLSRAASFSLQTPDTICTTSRHAALEFLYRHHGRVICKPLYSGYIERSAKAADTIIYTSDVDEEHLLAADAQLGCPTLFQAKIVDALDVRVTVVDDEVLACALRRTDAATDVRRDNMDGVQYNLIELPGPTRDSLIQLLRSYGLRFAAVDFMVVRDSQWVFLEVNPNGQWAWLDLLGGCTIYESFLRAFSRDR